MKQIFTLLFVLTFATIGVAQSFTNKPLIAKRTADWCPFCGGWGWDFKLKILEEIPADMATVVALHHSGGLNNPVANTIVQNLGGAGQPRFYLNNSDIGASSSNWNNKLEELKADVEALNNSIPEVGIELHAYPGETNEIISTLNLHINEALDGEFYVGSYLVTNDLIHNQAGNPDGSNANHQRILLDAFTDDAFGQLIGNGPILEGVMNFDITKTFEEVPEAKTDVIVIIWKKEGDNYLVVNSSTLENVQELTSVNDLQWVSDATATYAEGMINVDITSDLNIGEYRINLVSTNGQVVYSNNAYANDQNINENIDAANLINGNYFINVVTNKGKWNQQIAVFK